MSAMTDKVAVVTGASSGIGRAAAMLFAAEGAKVVAAGRRRDALEAVVAAIVSDGGEAVACVGDVRDPDHAAALVETACERFGGLDVGFNNAGDLGEMGPAAAISDAGWRATLETNLTGAFIAARRQLPAMIERGGGSIVFTGSFVGVSVGFPGMAAYASAKAGLVGLAKVVAAEYGAQGVRANVLLPGATETAMSALVANSEETRRFIEGLYPLGRFAQPDEIARAALFLASDASSFVTGSALFVDGGVSIART